MSGSVVCINVGEFDAILGRFSTIEGAEAFFQKISPFASVQLVIKPCQDARVLDETFTRDEILTEVSVKIGC